jgi:homeobox protein cut-like
MQVAHFQESSLESRKVLAAQARAFKACVAEASEEIRSGGGALVKAFKAEIDALTTRARHAEGVFLSLFKLLREAPDPALLVRRCAVVIHWHTSKYCFVTHNYVRSVYATFRCRG